MNDLEFDSGRSNSSGKSSGIGAMIVLTLFATPFAGFGLFAIIKGATCLMAGDTRNGIPLCIFGLIFSTVGFGLMAGAVFGRKKFKQKEQLQARYAGKPWMTRPDWAEGKVKSSAMTQSWVYLIMEHELHLTCSCVRRVVTGSGKNRSTEESVLWQSEKVYSEQANLAAVGPGQTGIPVHFKLPDDQPECSSQGSETVFWRLEAKSKMHGPRFRVLFELPVFRVAGAAGTGAEDTDPTAALQAPMEQIRRDENSKIKISDGPEGRDFYFPAARNPGSALLVTLFFLVWSGIFYVLVHSKAPLIFPIFWGITDVFLAVGCINAWFKSSRVTINSSRVRAVTRYLVFTRTRQWDAGEIARFATRTGMRSGSQVYTDIRLIPQGSDEKFAGTMGKMGEPADARQLAMARIRATAGPSGVTVASGIASTVEADWLVAEMNKALGH